jgi:tyrosyl-tRNA synthetase
MFGKIMSISDEMMPNYYELTTDVPLDEVRELLAGHPMAAKKRLAREVVAMYHGREAADEAQSAFERTFSDRQLPDEMPEAVISPEDMKEGSIWAGKLLTLTGMANGTREARRLLEQGGVTLDGEKIADPESDVQLRSGQVLRVGRRRFVRLRLKG